MKATLQLAVSQHLTLTPQLQQAIRLLQLSTQDLNQEIQQALESNPMLEISSNDHNITIVKKGDVPALEKIIAADASFHQNYASAPSKRSLHNQGSVNYENFISEERTLQDYLRWQLDLTPMSDTDYTIALTIIDAVNDDGFLTQSPDNILQGLLALNMCIELDEIEAVRHRLMRFDPLGVASLSLSECLLTQLLQLPDDTPARNHAQKILKTDITLLAQHNYRLLMRKYGIKEEELNAAIKLIQTLNPKPGNTIQPSKTEYVTPDVLVSKKDGQWVVRLNHDALPKLSINNHYASMIQRANNSSDNNFLKNNLQEARWFLKSIQSRQDTLLKVARCIIERQHGFLEKGEEAMQPLILNDIAEILGMHESTVSRVTTNKYIHTPRGVYELKYFFSSHLTTRTGGECSSTAIRALLKKLIANENQCKPLSDNKLSQILKEQGINVARRTIAKYREALGIAPSNERKVLPDK